MGILFNLLTKGYFPKELPPAFTTNTFARVVTQPSFNFKSCLLAANKKGGITDPLYGVSNLCKHHLSRLDGTKRIVHIPHPSHYYYLCRELESKWVEIDAHLKKSTLSISKPKTDTNSIRAFVSTELGAARPTWRMKMRARGNFLIATDITNFYGSVYTHSIPWALHTKQFSKLNRETTSCLGNMLDAYIRNAQDGQTSGIPVGPDTSFILAEVVLTSIDQMLQQKYENLIGFRFYDDYEFVCESESAASNLLSDLQDIVNYFELSLNQRKTRITRLPEEIDHSWLSDFRQFVYISEISRTKIRSGQEALLDFANSAFLLSKRYPNDPVLRYALVKASSIFQEKIPQFWELYLNFLLQIFRSEPQVAHLIASELLKYKSIGFAPKKDILKEAVNSHILQYAQARATNEVAWALWMAILFQVKLTDEVAKKISEIPDSIVAILSLDAQNNGLFTSLLDTTIWQSKLTQDQIYSEDWLLAYEAAVKEWLPIKDNSDYINTHQCFGELHRYGVNFYDETSYKDTGNIIKKLGINLDLYMN